MERQYTTQEFAKLMKVDESVVAAWRQTKNGPPFFKVKGVVRYKESLVDHWVDNNTFPHLSAYKQQKALS